MTATLTTHPLNQLSFFRRKEFQLLHFLYNNKNRVVSKHALLELIWNMDIYINSNTLEVHLSSLRRRLIQANSLFCIETIRGVGYRLVEQVPAGDSLVRPTPIKLAKSIS
jgi:DNA-binding response OmpR family regulator